MTELNSSQKCSPRVKIKRPNGELVSNINKIDLDTMQGVEVIIGEDICFKPIDLRDCTIIIEPIHEVHQ